MVRAGLIRQLGAGLWTWMPAGMRWIRKIEAIIRDEMDAIGAQEMLMPVLHPAENWQKTGRYEIDELFKLVDLVGAGLLSVLGGLKRSISVSFASIASISSRVIISIFRIERIPAGIQVQTRRRAGGSVPPHHQAVRDRLGVRGVVAEGRQEQR